MDIQVEKESGSRFLHYTIIQHAKWCVMTVGFLHQIPSRTSRSSCQIHNLQKIEAIFFVEAKRIQFILLSLSPRDGRNQVRFQ